MKSKVKRAIELEIDIARLNEELKAKRKEYAELMNNPYIYDKVNGLRTGGLL